MIDDGWTITSEQNAVELTGRYEALREHAIERHPNVVRHGIALLMRQGVAAWMQVSMATVAAPDTPPAPASGRRSCLPRATAEVVHVLAAMALQHMEVA